MAHYIKLDIQDSKYDDYIMYVYDLSTWDPNLQITDRILQVMPPHYDKFIKVHFPMNQAMALNSIHLQLSTKPAILPDGPYRFHYSVSPNDKVFEDRNYYRVAGIMNQVLGKMALASLDVADTLDECGHVTLEKEQNTLLHIWMILKGAQSVGRESHQVVKADKLYNQAVREFNRLYDLNSCVNC
jgi:hypothetical protein